MTKDKLPMTPALRHLKTKGVEHLVFLYRYQDHGGTATAAKELEVDEHQVIKTLVMEDDRGVPLIILMHGDMQVSTKNLARAVGAKTVTPCDPAAAEKHTGYTVGGISPFGTRKTMPIYVEKTILDLDRVMINAGRRGLLVEISPRALTEVLKAIPVSVAI